VSPKKKPEKTEKKRPKKTPRIPDPEERNFRLVIAYKGTHYRGWQKQAVSDGPPTVQEMLERAARTVLKKTQVHLHGSGRTDAGVHARAQVAHLRARVDLPAEVFIKALNAHLPDDVRILRLEECAADFHSQLDVTAKTYRYFVLNTQTGKDPVHWPFLRPYTWFVTYQLDYEAMRAALRQLEGTHDFRSFQNRGTPVEDTVREILEARLIIHGENAREQPPWMPGPEFDARLLEFRIRGTGFLKQMVRTIVGTVVEVGRGRLPADSLAKILEEKDRKAGGMTAPAQGLFLDHVEY
jgi:tRNA pseudouridine38-40 synthase